LLQWGCAFSSAEIDLIFVNVKIIKRASMGLRFFKRRNNFNYVQKKSHTKLQWGCAFSSAEIILAFQQAIRVIICFNGAALFQAQKFLVSSK